MKCGGKILADFWISISFQISKFIISFFKILFCCVN